MDEGREDGILDVTEEGIERLLLSRGAGTGIGVEIKSKRAETLVSEWGRTEHPLDLGWMRMD